MTTEALIETVLNYPLAINIVAYDSPQIGLEEVTKYFNGLQELSKRADATQKIKMIVSKNDSTINDRRIKKVFLSVLSGNYQSRSILTQYDKRGSIHYDYTPAGTMVPLIYNSTWADHGMTSTEGAQCQADYEETYPDAVVITSENPAYNCHSYTFVSTSTSNKYWLQPSYASYYINDGSYSVASPAKVGDKVWYGLYHSAIVRSISSGTVTVRSKWGYAGVFEHKVVDCPYNIPQIGLSHIKEYYNGLQELYTRDDAIEKMEVFINEKLPKLEDWRKERWAKLILEDLLLQQ